MVKENLGLQSNLSPFLSIHRLMLLFFSKGNDQATLDVDVTLSNIAPTNNFFIELIFWKSHI